MEVISKDKKAQELNFDQDDLLDKIDKLQISAEDKFKLKQVCVEEFKNLEPEHDTDKKHKKILQAIKLLVILKTLLLTRMI